MSTQEETRIKNSIRQHIMVHGGRNSFVHTIVAGALQGKGQLDLVGAYKGVPFMVDVKTPTGQGTVIQKAEVRRARRGGYVAGLVSSIEDFEVLFDD